VLVAQFGEAHQAYMQRVPRMDVVAGLFRALEKP
jgi:protein-S-isoprenylcysteine O-methyltransferase Ste14